MPDCPQLNASDLHGGPEKTNVDVVLNEAKRDAIADQDRQKTFGTWTIVRRHRRRPLNSSEAGNVRPSTENQFQLLEVTEAFQASQQHGQRPDAISEKNWDGRSAGKAATAASTGLTSASRSKAVERAGRKNEMTRAVTPVQSSGV